MITLAQHRRAESPPTVGAPVRGRLAVLPPDLARSRIRREGVLVRSVSITESYVHGQLVTRLVPLAPAPRSELVETLYGQFEDKGTSSWPDMEAYFKAHLHKGVGLKSHPQWNRVNALIEARNAIVHGLGRFTARQHRKGTPGKVDTHLKALGFELAKDGRIWVTPRALEQSAELLRAYLEWLDQLITEKLGTPPP